MASDRTRAGNRPGFTLIEVLVVLFVIGILASISMPRFTESVVRADAAAAARTIHDVDEAVGQVLAAHGWAAFEGTPYISVIGPNAAEAPAKLAATHLDEYITPEAFDLGWGNMVLYVPEHLPPGRRRLALMIQPRPVTGEANTREGTRRLEALGAIFGPRWDGAPGLYGELNLVDEVDPERSQP